MAYVSSPDSGSDTTVSSDLSFLRSSSEDTLSSDLRERNNSNKYPRKKWLQPEQQSRLLIKRDPVGLFPDKEKSSISFKRERRTRRHCDIDGNLNKGAAVSLFKKEYANLSSREKWARTARDLEISVVSNKNSGFKIRKRGKELDWRPDFELLTPPSDGPTSYSIYEGGYKNPDVQIPLRIKQSAELRRTDRYVPLLRPQVHALEGGIVHIFDSRSLKTYRLLDKQEFELIASLRFDEMHMQEQLTCLSFVSTRHSIALGFADGNAAICRMEIDNSTQSGRGRHNFEYVMAPAGANLVITKIEQHPCTPRFSALCYYDSPRMNYIVRVIDHDRLLDEQNATYPASEKEKEFFSQYPENDMFGACQGPFRTVDGKEPIPMKEPRQHARILSLRTVEKVTDLMWFSDRRNLIMIFTERTMRLLDVSKEDKEKVLKSCTLARPLTRPSVHPGMPSLFSALDLHRVNLYDRRCLKSPVLIIDVPNEALSRGIPNLATWCTADMNTLVVHYKSSQRAALIHFTRYPNCSRLSDGACDADTISPVIGGMEKEKEQLDWNRDINDDFPITHTDHFLAEEDLDGGLMEAVPYPEGWENAQLPLVWKPEFEVRTLAFAGHSNMIRRVQSNPDVSTTHPDGNFVHPFKRYVKVARDRRDESVFNDCVEWKIWEQIHSLNRKRSKSEERPKKVPLVRYKYAEEEDLCRSKVGAPKSSYVPRLEKNEIVYPVYTSDFIDVPVLETILMIDKRQRHPSNQKRICNDRKPRRVRREFIEYESTHTELPPGPVVLITKDNNQDVLLNSTRIPFSRGGLYYGIQGRPVGHARTALANRIEVTHDDSIKSEKKKAMMKEKRRDDILRLLMDEEQDLMSVADSRWLKLHETAACASDRNEPKFDPFVQNLRKTRIHDSDNSESSSSNETPDDSHRRVNHSRDIKKHAFTFVEDRSLFGVSSAHQRNITNDWNITLLELPVEDPQSLCVFSFSMEMIVQGVVRSTDILVPNSAILKITVDESSKEQPRLSYPQVPDMSAYLRSVFGQTAIQSVKLSKLAGFGEFTGADVPKGYMDSLQYLRQHIEDSEGNRFALDYIERLFNDNHIGDHDRGFPRRFEVPSPVYSDTTDEDDPKKKKKQSLFATSNDRPKMEQLKEKLYKKRRENFLKRRRACEALKINYDSIFPQPEVQKQRSLCNLYDKGDPKRSILQDPVPKAVYDRYSGSSDSNEEAHYLPQVQMRQLAKRDYDFEEEEQMIARETKEIEMIQRYRKQGRIPPLEFLYDDEGNMLPPTSATLDEEYHLNIQSTRTLLRRMVERDARIHELTRRKEMLLDRLPEEVAEDTYDRMMSDMKEAFDELEDHEFNLTMTGNFFRNRKIPRRRHVYGRGWRRNRKLQHKFLDQSLDLCDRICKVRQSFEAQALDEEKRRKQLRNSQKKAKQLLRDINRRDVNGSYMRVIREVQFRRHRQLRDFDLNDFLEAFEEITLKMCGLQYSSHHEMLQAVAHSQKDQMRSTEGRFCHDSVCIIHDSDSDSTIVNNCSASTDSSSSLSDQPIILQDRQKRLVKKRQRKIETTSTSDSEDTEDTYDDSEENSVIMTPQGKPRKESEAMSDISHELEEDECCLFYEEDANLLPISTLAHNPIDPLKQLPIFSRKDISTPPRVRLQRTKRIKNRKQRNKRDKMNQISEEIALKKDRKAIEKKAMNEITELLEKTHISSPSEREAEWRRKRDKKMKDGMRNSWASPGRAAPHRSITRKLLDKLRIGGGTRAIRVYTNGSIYPPSKIPHTHIFDKFDPYTNPFARKPAADPEKPRPRPTFIDDGNIEIAVAVDTNNEKSIFPPDEFAYPLRPWEKIPNNVEWVFPNYWNRKISRREKQRRKRKRRWLARANDDHSKYFARDKSYLKFEDTSSDSTGTTRVESSVNNIPELTADEIFMARYVSIANPGLIRSYSCNDLNQSDVRTMPVLTRSRSCIGRITEEMEPLDAVEAEFAGSQELPPPPGLIIDEHGRHLWCSDKNYDGPRCRPRYIHDDNGSSQLRIFHNPQSDESDSDYDDDATPIPPSDEDKTPTESNHGDLSQYQTPESGGMLSDIVKEHMNSAEPYSIAISSEIHEHDLICRVHPRGVELEMEKDLRACEKFDCFMERLFFEDLSVVSEPNTWRIALEHIHVSDIVRAAWLSLRKTRKFKRVIHTSYGRLFLTIPEVDIEDYSRRNLKAVKELVFIRPTVQVILSHTDNASISNLLKYVRPGTPYVDAVHFGFTEEDRRENEERSDTFNCSELDDIEATDIDYDLEDEHYPEDQYDDEIMDCFHSNSDEEPIGDSPAVNGELEHREESIETDPIDAASTVCEAPTIPSQQNVNVAVEVTLENVDDISSDGEADEEVMNVFGRNLVHPDFPDGIYPNVATNCNARPPQEEMPLCIEQSDEDVDDEITVAEEALDSLIESKQTNSVPIIIPPAIARPERLLDLMPSNLIFEGVDYWGLTEAQMEEALDEVITQREKIRNELLKPLPKARHVYRLVHEEDQDGRLIEIVAIEFSSSDSESIDLCDSWSKSISPEKFSSTPVIKCDGTNNIVYTSGELEIAPPTPPLKKDKQISAKDKRRLESHVKWWRDTNIDKSAEDEAWQHLLDYVQCEFSHNSYGRKPVVNLPELNLLRGMPRHILKAYINQMRIRRWEELDLMEQLEEQNHLYRLKGVESDLIQKRKAKKHEPDSIRDYTVKFADPIHRVPSRIYQPIRSAPQKKSILRREIQTPEPIDFVEPVVEVPLKKEGTTKFVFKKATKIYDAPHPDDTKFPTEQSYNVETAKKMRSLAQKHLLRPGTIQYKTQFIYKCKGIPGIIHIAMNEISVKKEFIKDTALLGGFYFMRSRERIAVLRGIGLCDYKSDQIADILETRRLQHENPFALALMALIMGQGTYTINFLNRVQQEGWYSHRSDDDRVRAEADAHVRYFLLFCEWRTENQRLPRHQSDSLRRKLLDKYLEYKQLEDSCIFTRCMMAFLLTLAYSETRHFVDDIVYCKNVPMMFRVAFTTLFCENTMDWQQTLLELLKELPPDDIQRFVFTGVGRHPDSINAILEFAKHTSDVQLASFLLIVGECCEVHPMVDSPKKYERRGNRLLDPRREIFKYWFALNNEMESSNEKERRLKIYPELISAQSALLGYTIEHDIYHVMKEKARPPMEQLFPVAILYPHTNMALLDQQVFEIMRHYAYVLQVTHNWIAAAQIFYMLKQSETAGIRTRFETEMEIACSFCCTTLSYGRTKARILKKEEKKKLDDARERHMEAQRKRMEQGLAPQPFTGAPKKGPVKDIPDDVDTKIRAIACLACRKPLPRCAICFNHMFNPVANEEGLRGEQVGFGFAACRRCHHGGHPDHLDVWFRENYRCPVAQCNCECDYDNYWDTLTLHESLDYKLLGAPQITLGARQGCEPTADNPEPENSDSTHEDDGDGDDEEERELKDAKKRFCYGRISVD